MYVYTNISGCFLVSQMNNWAEFSHFKPEVIICNDEAELVNAFIQFVNNWDPEIICGYEVSLRLYQYYIYFPSYLLISKYNFFFVTLD